MGKLGQAELGEALASLPDWRHDSEAGAISRDFKFRDFSEAFAFMARVALLAEAANHHPEWSNIYNRVSIRLTTHDDKGLSGKDTALAAKIDALLR